MIEYETAAIYRAKRDTEERRGTLRIAIKDRECAPRIYARDVADFFIGNGGKVEEILEVAGREHTYEIMKKNGNRGKRIWALDEEGVRICAQKYFSEEESERVIRGLSKYIERQWETLPSPIKIIRKEGKEELKGSGREGRDRDHAVREDIVLFREERYGGQKKTVGMFFTEEGETWYRAKDIALILSPKEKEKVLRGIERGLDEGLDKSWVREGIRETRVISGGALNKIVEDMIGRGEIGESGRETVEELYNMSAEIYATEEEVFLSKEETLLVAPDSLIARGSEADGGNSEGGSEMNELEKYVNEEGPRKVGEVAAEVPVTISGGGPTEVGESEEGRATKADGGSAGNEVEGIMDTIEMSGVEVKIYVPLNGGYPDPYFCVRDMAGALQLKWENVKKRVPEEGSMIRGGEKYIRYDLAAKWLQGSGVKMSHDIVAGMIATIQSKVKKRNSTDMDDQSERTHKEGVANNTIRTILASPSRFTDEMVARATAIEIEVFRELSTEVRKAKGKGRGVLIGGGPTDRELINRIYGEVEYNVAGAKLNSSWLFHVQLMIERADTYRAMLS